MSLRSGQLAVPSRNHVFLTRFNLPSEGVESLIRAKPEWLAHRVDLFETYCLPSLQGQSDQNFHWIIYFDPESPQWLIDKIMIWRVKAPILPLFRARVSDAERLADIKEAVGTPADELMTTNIDNDDGLAFDFVERLARYHRVEARCAVYFGWGLIKAGRRLYLRRDDRNAFCSVLESWAEPATCWAAPHNELGRLMPEVALDGDPAWLQVVHETNVSNRVHGRRVRVSPYRAGFPHLEASEPGTAELLADRWVAQPLRLARTGARKGAKALVLKLGGRQGSERVKYLWQKLRRGGGANML